MLEIFISWENRERNGKNKKIESSLCRLVLWQIANIACYKTSGDLKGGKSLFYWCELSEVIWWKRRSLKVECLEATIRLPHRLGMKMKGRRISFRVIYLSEIFGSCNRNRVVVVEGEFTGRGTILRVNSARIYCVFMLVGSKHNFAHYALIFLLMNTKCWNDDECDAEESKQPLLSTLGNVINFEFHLNFFQDENCMHPDVKLKTQCETFSSQGEDWVRISKNDDDPSHNSEYYFNLHNFWLRGSFTICVMDEI